MFLDFGALSPSACNNSRTDGWHWGTFLTLRQATFWVKVKQPQLTPYLWLYMYLCGAQSSFLSVLTFQSLPTGLTFNDCTLCPRCIYVFCIYLRTNSDLCHLQHKLIGFYNRDEKCLQRGTDWVFKYSGLHFVFKGLKQHIIDQMKKILW